MNAFLPRTGSKALAAVIILLCAGLAYLAARSALAMVESPGIGPAVGIAIFVAFAIGLWRLNRFARGVAVFVLWSVVLMLIVGGFSPFSAGDLMAEGKDVPGIWELAAWMAPWVVACLAALHVLGKHKAEFAAKSRTAD